MPAFGDMKLRSDYQGVDLVELKRAVNRAMKEL